MVWKMSLEAWSVSETGFVKKMMILRKRFNTWKRRWSASNLLADVTKNVRPSKPPPGWHNRSEAGNRTLVERIRRPAGLDSTPERASQTPERETLTPERETLTPERASPTSVM